MVLDMTYKYPGQVGTYRTQEYLALLQGPLITHPPVVPYYYFVPPGSKT